ncbi:hypothetical protein ASPACDRAFT_112707 [Aspergillus aculeatus ATCC 16872]|uniref:SnoaL-like domain-containing protein n=1 Tax=Aspergillus aculeatus (strain ATCC 16872 / CBS 172.66 / WB 5094) TaxID=690307 RepID=A0A1L9X715_ASPA1|nr:uncharacterized protein ASPACDRAFT_112707 [Aspergillus aculeatus ATCC 16872]OJK04256.1 hypothetical protein ASPACDRAFT_112707 [Aspergillus aculeatus ATCC 16872]
MPSTTTPHPAQRAVEPHPTPPLDPTTHQPSYAPNPDASLPLSPTRQAIQRHILNLYGGSASASDMQVYAEQAVYDDPLSYCDTRYKIAGQWYGIPKLFARSETLATEVVASPDDELVWKQRQRYTVAGVHASKVVDSLVSLRLEAVGGQEKVVYHKDMWNEKDYDHEGFGAWVKKLNGDKLTHVTQPPEEI